MVIVPGEPARLPTNVRTMVPVTVPPVNIVSVPLTMLEPPEAASTYRAEFVTKIAPPLLMSRLLINRSGVATPTLVSCSVLIPAPNPCTVKLLIVRLPEGVAELIVTVFVEALVMRMAASVLVGATPADQEARFPQNWLALLIQLLVVSAAWAGAVSNQSAARANSDRAKRFILSTSGETSTELFRSRR